MITPTLASQLALVFVLAFLAETLTEYFARPFLRPETLPGHEASTGSAEPAPMQDPETWKPLLAKTLLRYAAAVAGVLLAFAYRADLLAILGLVAWSPWIGYLVTGLIIGRGSNYLHDLVDRWLAPVAGAGRG